MPEFTTLVSLLQLAVKDRTQLALENIALRQQLAVYELSVKRPHIKDRDHIFWLSVMRTPKVCRKALARCAIELEGFRGSSGAVELLVCCERRCVAESR